MDELLARIAQLERAQQAEKRRARRWLAAGLCVLILGLVALAPRPSLSAASNSQQGGLPSLDQRVTQLEGVVAALQQSNSDQAGQIAALKLRADQDENALAALTLRVTQAESALTAQSAHVAAVEAKTAPISVVGTDFIISGKNVFVQDGSGGTESLSGLGNLIVGYNEDGGSARVRTGAHNLVVGTLHSYSSFGGLVAGQGNTLTGRYNSISGGTSNTTAAFWSTVSGGTANQATGDYSTVSGGGFNRARNSGAVVSGGEINTSNGTYSTVSGGLNRSTSILDFGSWAAGGLFQAN